MSSRNVLALAVASGRAGFVFLRNGEPQDWGVTVKSVQSATELAGYVQTLINELKPDVMVTEKCDERCRKGAHARHLIRAIAETASYNALHDVAVPRPRRFRNKYHEAAYLTGRYPDLAGYLPEYPPRCFEYEPRQMILFEALALAEVVIADQAAIKSKAKD